jgi:MtfA peptidase
MQILERNVPLYLLLPQHLRQELYGRINIFLGEKEFIGCGDLEITDEIRLTIAGNASILLLGHDRHCFPGFTSILVYPDTYVAKEINYDGLVETHEDSARAGESWHRGPVVLSWADVLRDTLDQNDGHNVVLHEFAHKLDEENEIMDGLPVLRDTTHYRKWAEVLTREYDSLQNSIDRGTDTVLDDYGAYSPPEFFAVATETFFEQPLRMKNKLPELYEQLKIFYNLDPAAWRHT